MQHSFSVTITQAFYNLFEEVLGNIFLELSTSAHIGQKVSSAADFHHKDNVLCCLKRFVESHYVLVASPLQNVELLHHLAF